MNERENKMNNKKFTLYIEAKDIYDKLVPEEKEQINNIEIIGVELHNGQTVVIECLALKDKVTDDLSYKQNLLIGKYINVS